MWKEILLQVLITFLPVMLFMAWYERPERSRYAPVFMGIVFGCSMLLCTQFSYTTDFGQPIDFRHIPLILGSLYAGVPTAAILTVVYFAARIGQLAHFWQYIVLGSFLLVFVPLLFALIPRFQKASKASRFRIAYLLAFFLLAFFAVSSVISTWGMRYKEMSSFTAEVVVYGLSFLVVVGFCVHFMDISYDRVQLQSQLRDISLKYRNEVRRLQQLIDNTPLIVVFCDSKGCITHVNDMALKHAFPTSRKEALGIKFDALLDQMGFQYDICPVKRVLESEERVTDMMRARGRTFYTITCQVKEAPLHRVEGVLFVGQDITELQRLKDEVDKMERLSLVGQMAASITHEIRNPMAVIRGFVQLLNERGGEDQQSYFRIVLDELDRANAIINDFLSLAQNRIVEKESGNLHDLLNDLLPLIWADANMRGQMVDLRLCEEMDRLEMNSKEIKQLVLNLARNGMEAMNDKGVLRIETINFKDTVQLRITDTGVGIPREKLDRLFEPFYTTKTNGTGLGLPLCLSIVERHNGKIHVESTVGQGTSFIVSFCKPGRSCW